MYVFWEEGVTKDGEGKESRKWGRAVWILGIFEYSIVVFVCCCGRVGVEERGKKEERKSCCGERKKKEEVIAIYKRREVS